MVSQHGHSTEYNSFVLIFYDIIRSYVISYTHIRDGYRVVNIPAVSGYCVENFTKNLENRRSFIKYCISSLEF